MEQVPYITPLDFTPTSLPTVHTPCGQRTQAPHCKACLSSLVVAHQCAAHHAPLSHPDKRSGGRSHQSSGRATCDRRVPLRGQVLVLRILRVLRPLRLLSHVPGMTVIFTFLVDGIQDIVNVVGVVFFFHMLFAVVGMELFSGPRHDRATPAPTSPTLDPSTQRSSTIFLYSPHPSIIARADLHATPFSLPPYPQGGPRPLIAWLLKTFSGSAAWQGP